MYKIRHNSIDFSDHRRFLKHLNIHELTLRFLVATPCATSRNVGPSSVCQRHNMMKTKAHISLRGDAGWSAPLLFAIPKAGFLLSRPN